MKLISDRFLQIVCYLQQLHKNTEIVGLLNALLSIKTHLLNNLLYLNIYYFLTLIRNMIDLSYKLLTALNEKEVTIGVQFRILILKCITCFN